MDEKNWNRRQIIKLSKWLINHCGSSSRIVVNWGAIGVGDIRLYSKPLEEMPAITIYVYGVFDVFIPGCKKTYERCWCKGQVIDYIKKNASNLLGGK